MEKINYLFILLVCIFLYLLLKMKYSCLAHLVLCLDVIIQFCFVFVQIRKALKRKHTFPYYKLRYKPFFPKSDPGAALNDNVSCSTSGVLEITVVQVSRISDCIGPVYCSLAVGKSIVKSHNNPNNYTFLNCNTLNVYNHLFTSNH